MNEAPKPNDQAQQVRFVEFEDPDLLAEGQNFYDQSVFNRIIEDAQARTGVSIEVARKIIYQFQYGYLVHFFSRRDRGYDYLDLEEEMSKLDHPNPRIRELAAERVFAGLVLSNVVPRTTHGFENQDKMQYASAAWKIKTAMEEYPHLREYVRTQHTIGVYRPDGTFRPGDGAGTLKNYGASPTPSYPNWVFTVLEGEQSALRVGLEEIFPQDIADLSGERQKLSTFPGRTRATRHWRMRLAAETVREKR